MVGRDRTISWSTLFPLSSLFTSSSSFIKSFDTWRTCRTSSSKTLTILITLLSLALLTRSVHSQNNVEVANSRQDVVCGNIDIRNNASNFAQLENCTVVEGHVQIVLIDRGTPKDYEDLSFPKLREITDYLLLFRAYGMVSIGKLFPNLAVIRGRELFHNFAFVVYEMMQLQEIGLTKLTDIVRGSVRIEKNPNLCFADTIDWDRICKGKTDRHYILGNKDKHRCPTCRNDGGITCPIGEASGSGKRRIGDPNGRLCWNSTTCQKVCDSECVRYNKTCNDQGSCCHPECLGGCTEPNSPLHCIACKSVRFEDRCLPKCKIHTYSYMNRRCVSEAECHYHSKSHSGGGTNSVFLKAIPANWDVDGAGECREKCPVGYQEDKMNQHKCVKCEGKCPKLCEGVSITNINKAHELRGCTVINGTLEISIQGDGDKILKELEAALGDVEEIRGSLKVVRSFPLVTLHFFKSLKVIGTPKNNEESKSYVLHVVDNRNLQELFPWNGTTPNQMKIYGKVYFHINPKLCMDRIEALKKYAGVGNWEEHEVSRTSNGDRTACDVHKLDVNIISMSHGAVILNFTDFRTYMDDPRSLISYLIYYKETKEKNVSIFEGRDACGSDGGWEVEEFEPTIKQHNESSINGTGTNNCELHLITQLSPYTQYALYIKTFTISSESKGAQSDIVYFTTQPFTPTQPRNVQGKALSPFEVFINWDPPSHPNGLIKHYIVIGRKEEDSLEFLDQRDYCNEPSYLYPESVTNRIGSTETNTTEHWKSPHSSDSQNPLNSSRAPGNDSGHSGQSQDNRTESECCSCSESKQKPSDREVDKTGQIQFEDHLINIVYVKKQQSQKRRKRSLEELQLLMLASSDPPSNEVNYLNQLSRHHRSPDSIPSSSPNSLSTSSSSSKAHHHLRHNLTKGGSTSSPSTSESQQFPSTSTPTTLSTIGDSISESLDANNTNSSSIAEVPTFSEFFQQNVSVRLHIQPNLTHFTAYNIEVRACQEQPKMKDGQYVDKNYESCSVQAITTVRTLPLGGADDVDYSSITAQPGNGTENEIILTWSEPPSPNGAIVSYQIEYERVDSDGSRGTPHSICINRTTYMKRRGYFLRDLPTGNYSLRLKATSLAQTGNWTAAYYFIVPDAGSQLAFFIWVMIFVSFIVFLVAAGLGIYVYRKVRPGSDLNVTSVNPEYHPTDFYKPDEWEVSPEKVKLLEELGRGSFGITWRGIVTGLYPNNEGEPEIETYCAVKTPNDNASGREIQEFLQEASVMKAFDCHHVVRLLGITSCRPYYVLMELMEGGDLKNYLRNNRPEGENPDPKPPTVKQVLQCAAEIADGMAYLAQKKFVHRDLATRNCMLTKELTAKIGDFGMTRDVYETDYYRKGGKSLMPVRWMAPESLRDGVFTTATDVWSYGVVLWEMATLAAQPYQGLSNEEVVNYVIRGGKMERPDNCPNKIWNLIEMCWAEKPKARPTFVEIVEILYPDVDDNFRSRSFYDTQRPFIGSEDLNEVHDQSPEHEQSVNDEEEDNGDPLDSEDDVALMENLDGETASMTLLKHRNSGYGSSHRSISGDLDEREILMTNKSNESLPRNQNHQKGRKQRNLPDGSSGQIRYLPTAVKFSPDIHDNCSVKSGTSGHFSGKLSGTQRSISGQISAGRTSSDFNYDSHNNPIINSVAVNMEYDHQKDEQTKPIDASHNQHQHHQHQRKLGASDSGSNDLASDTEPSSDIDAVDEFSQHYQQRHNRHHHSHHPHVHPSHQQNHPAYEEDNLQRHFNETDQLIMRQPHDTHNNQSGIICKNSLTSSPPSTPPTARFIHRRLNSSSSTASLSTTASSSPLQTSNHQQRNRRHRHHRHSQPGDPLPPSSSLPNAAGTAENLLPSSSSSSSLDRFHHLHTPHAVTSSFVNVSSSSPSGTSAQLKVGGMDGDGAHILVIGSDGRSPPSDGGEIDCLENEMIREQLSQGNDGSKGSKISTKSTASNGSIANGHVAHFQTTAC